MLIDIPISTLLIWLACHFIGDFAFQSTWMSIEKGKNWEVNFYHCATYTAVFILFANPTLLATAILFGTHFVVDPLKARYKLIGPIWVDQGLGGPLGSPASCSSGPAPGFPASVDAYWRTLAVPPVIIRLSWNGALHRCPPDNAHLSLTGCDSCERFGCAAVQCSNHQ